MKKLILALTVLSVSGCANMLASHDLAALNCHKLGYEGDEKTQCIREETADIRKYRASKPQSSYNWQQANQDMHRQIDRNNQWNNNAMQRHNQQFNQMFWQQQQLQGNLPAVIIKP